MRTTPLVLILLAIIAVGIGIYVINTGSGNDRLETASATDACPAGAAYAEALDPMLGGDVAAMRIVDEAVNVSALAFNDVNGNPVTLGAWKGKTVLLNLWATWCPPCIAEMPALEALEKSEGGEDFQVVPVSIDLDNPDKPKAFYAKMDLAGLPFFHEGGMVVFNTLKKQGLAFGMPTTLLVDRNSCVIAVMSGPAEWAGSDAKRLIRAAIAADKSG